MHVVFLAGLLLLGEGSTAQAVSGQQSAAQEPRATVEQQMRQGENMLGARRFEDALAFFNQVLARIPDYGPALAGRALAYARTNRLIEATRDVDAAARVMPDSALLHIVRGTIAQRRSDDPGAIREYTRALELDPGNKDALSSRAGLYQQSGNHDAAIADAETYIAAWPDSVDGYMLQADLLIDQRHRARAAAVAERLLRRSPGNALFLAAAAIIYDSLADRANALATMDRAIALDPEFFALRLYRARFRRWDDFAGRRADLDVALRLEPGHNDIITELALVDFAERKWRDAISRISTILALEPRDFGLLAYRAMAYLNAGERALAERDYRTAMAASEGGDDFNLICFSLAREGFALDWAREACDRAVALNAGESAYRASRGLLELRLGRLDAALSDYDAAVAADARRADGYYGRALVHHRRGESQAAAADRSEALAIDPGIAETYQGYGFSPF